MDQVNQDSENSLQSPNPHQFSLKDFQLSYRRQFTKNFYIILMGIALLLILLPVLSILLLVATNGLPVVVSSFPNFFILRTQDPTATSAGMANAIQGTILIVGIASLIGIPVGILAGMRLAESKQTFFVNMTRFTTRVLVGLPSIVAGLIIYIFIIVPLGTQGYGSFSSGLALTLLVVPMIAITTEEALRTVPTTYREASLALGIPNYRINIDILMKASLNVILTGIVVAIARVGGETAPLIYTIGQSQFFAQGLFRPATALPLNVYLYAMSNYPSWHAQAWGAALVLLLIALCFTFVLQTDAGKTFIKQFVVTPSGKIYEILVHKSTTNRPKLLEQIFLLNTLLFILMLAGSIITLTGGLYITLLFIFVILTFPVALKSMLSKVGQLLEGKSIFTNLIRIFLAVILLVLTYISIFQSSSVLMFLSTYIDYLILILALICVIFVIAFFISKNAITKGFSSYNQKYFTPIVHIYALLLYLSIVYICIVGLYNIINFTQSEVHLFGIREEDILSVILIVVAIIGIVLIRIVSQVSNIKRYILLIIYSCINVLVIGTGVGFKMDSPIVTLTQLFQQTWTQIFSLNTLIVNVFLILYTIGINLGLFISLLTLLILFFDKNTRNYFRNTLHSDNISS